ncbi:MAG: diaminopimelate decarboxylase [Myxococcales bacterium]|nr:diaminopimelate decarboxylase [Myxococcales bacterium]
MDHFNYVDGQLCCESVPLARIVADVGSPCYVYSYATLRRHYEVFAAALAGADPASAGTAPRRERTLICYSAKANTNGAVLAALAQLGCGADVVSGGELFRVLLAGIPPERVVFSGVGKQEDEISAALKAGILMFNVESEAELALVDEVAGRLGRTAPISFRVNPDVDAQTHPYISTGLKESKFGVPIDRAPELYARARALANVEVRGIDCHIGSQLTRLEPMLDAVRAVLDMARRLQAEGFALTHLDIGGGLGIPYKDGDAPPAPAAYGKAVFELFAEYEDLDLTLVCEPGRVIMGNAGVMVCRVLLEKQSRSKRFVVVDAAMNDLLRPSLYNAHHTLLPVIEPSADAPRTPADVVGPICESGDFLAKDRALPPLASGELLVARTAGAYGASMSSNYNSRPRVAEVLVRDDRYAVVRKRETYEDLVRGETIPKWVRER